MMRSSMGASNPQVERVVKEMLAEDLFFDRHENRSAHREHLVRPVTIECRGQEQTIAAFSRNISATGIGIVSSQDIPTGTSAVLEIGRLKNSSQRILAECRWSRNYGKDWYISGWQFVALKR